MAELKNDMDVFTVVVNHEEQYSLWHKNTPLPMGWSEVGFTGGREECLQHIESVWTDMTPKSARLQRAADMKR